MGPMAGSMRLTSFVDRFVDQTLPLLSTAAPVGPRPPSSGTSPTIVPSVRRCPIEVPPEWAIQTLPEPSTAMPRSIPAPVSDDSYAASSTPAGLTLRTVCQNACVVQMRPVTGSTAKP